AFRLLTSYNPAQGVDGLWYGNIERMRWTCESGVPEEQEKLESSGDAFHRNVALNLGQRQFVTFVPEPVGGLYRGTETLRPHYGSGLDDGAGVRGGTQETGLGTGFSTLVPADALEIDFATDAACISTAAADDDTCRTRILNWTLGYDDGAGNNRCPNPSDENNCAVIGDILHSTPTSVDRPTGIVEDETYTTFAETNQGRMMMAY